MSSPLVNVNTVDEVNNLLNNNSSVYPHKIDYSSESNIYLNHTCLRIKDPKRSIDFYTNILNFKLINVKKFPEWKFDLYFLSLNHSLDEKDIFNTNGILELTHNYGTESMPDYEVNNGNDVSKGRGFGHICLTVFDIQKVQEELLAKNVSFKKRLEDGNQKDICFIYDPDLYWIELVCYGNRPNYKQENEVLITEDKGVFFNHTMLRVKDPLVSLKFYCNVLNMTLLEFKHHPNAKFTVYFLSYKTADDFTNPRRAKEGILELTHNWGTEDDETFSYHNGNTNPQGYGHTCVTLKNAEAICKSIEKVYEDIKWQPKWGEGGMKTIAFILDPDGYKVEIVNQKGV